MSPNTGVETSHQDMNSFLFEIFYVFRCVLCHRLTSAILFSPQDNSYFKRALSYKPSGKVTGSFSTNSTWHLQTCLKRSIDFLTTTENCSSLSSKRQSGLIHTLCCLRRKIRQARCTAAEKCSAKPSGIDLWNCTLVIFRMTS